MTHSQKYSQKQLAVIARLHPQPLCDDNRQHIYFTHGYRPLRCSYCDYAPYNGTVIRVRYRANEGRPDSYYRNKWYMVEGNDAYGE